jgi:hypothetical protein
MAGTEPIKLDYPIEIDGVKIKELKMRRPKLRDQLASQAKKGSDAVKEVSLFCNLLEQPPETLDELDLLDYKKLQETYTGFLS